MLVLFIILLLSVASNAQQTSTSSIPLCLSDEREALLTFKNSFNNFFYSWKNDSNNSDCCQWEGVTCDPSSGHVTKLGLNENWINGSFHSNNTLINLRHLQFLSLSGSKITGIIPTWLFALPSLKYLQLENCLFTGLAQDEIKISASSSLVWFSAYDNHLQGKIPEFIFELPSLQYLDLEENNLTGTIPLSKLHKLHNLDRLFLSGNNFSIIDDMDADTTSSWPNFRFLGLSSCNLGHFPDFLREQMNLESLDLSNNGIHGPVPEWLFDIGTTTLTILDLSYNFLTGSFGNMTWQNMEQIDIRSNMLQGAIPIPPLSTFYYSASNNRFTGGIPTPFCDVGLLAFIDLSTNSLTGTIPDCLVEQGMLILDLKRNQFQGVIPSFLFGKCSWLITLSLSDNQLEGPIPQSLSKCKELQLLDLGSNNLNDTFPHWLNVLPDLQVLILGSNKLAGSLMSSNTTSSFLKLRILDISNNDFVGNLPRELLMSMKGMVKVNQSDPLSPFGPYMGVDYYRDSIKAWVKGLNRQLDVILDTLVLIDASKNNLEGPIPQAIGDLLSLRWLNLAHNNFTGSIASSLGNLPLLETLDLSFNRLDGQIPGELVNLNSLEIFNVSENNLVGPVPTGKQFDTFSGDSYLGNPGLCGQLLTNKCGKQGGAPNPTAAEGSLSETSGLHEWEIALMGYGCGMFVGFVWGYFIFWETIPKWVSKLILELQVITMLHQWRHQNRRN